MLTQVPRSTSVYSPEAAASSTASRGNATNLWYQGEYGSDHGVWPIVVQIRDSRILFADLSYRDRKRIGAEDSADAIAAWKSSEKSSKILAWPSVGKLAGFKAGPIRLKASRQRYIGGRAMPC